MKTQNLIFILAIIYRINTNYLFIDLDKSGGDPKIKINVYSEETNNVENLPISERAMESLFSLDCDSKIKIKNSANFFIFSGFQKNPEVLDKKTSGDDIFFSFTKIEEINFKENIFCLTKTNTSGDLLIFVGNKKKKYFFIQPEEGDLKLNYYYISEGEINGDKEPEKKSLEEFNSKNNELISNFYLEDIISSSDLFFSFQIFDILEDEIFENEKASIFDDVKKRFMYFQSDFGEYDAKMYFGENIVAMVRYPREQDYNLIKFDLKSNSETGLKLEMKKFDDDELIEYCQIDYKKKHIYLKTENFPENTLFKRVNLLEETIKNSGLKKIINQEKTINSNLKTSSHNYKFFYFFKTPEKVNIKKELRCLLKITIEENKATEIEIKFLYKIMRPNEEKLDIIEMNKEIFQNSYTNNNHKSQEIFFTNNFFHTKLDCKNKENNYLEQYYPFKVILNDGMIIHDQESSYVLNIKYDNHFLDSQLVDCNFYLVKKNGESELFLNLLTVEDLEQYPKLIFKDDSSKILFNSLDQSADINNFYKVSEHDIGLVNFNINVQNEDSIILKRTIEKQQIGEEICDFLNLKLSDSSVLNLETINDNVKGNHFNIYNENKDQISIFLKNENFKSIMIDSEKNVILNYYTEDILFAYEEFKLKIKIKEKEEISKSFSSWNFEKFNKLGPFNNYNNCFIEDEEEIFNCQIIMIDEKNFVISSKEFDIENQKKFFSEDFLISFFDMNEKSFDYSKIVFKKSKPDKENILVTDILFIEKKPSKIKDSFVSLSEILKIQIFDLKTSTLKKDIEKTPIKIIGEKLTKKEMIRNNIEYFIDDYGVGIDKDEIFESKNINLFYYDTNNQIFDTNLKRNKRKDFRYEFLKEKSLPNFEGNDIIFYLFILKLDHQIALNIILKDKALDKKKIFSYCYKYNKKESSFYFSIIDPKNPDSSLKEYKIQIDKKFSGFKFEIHKPISMDGFSNISIFNPFERIKMNENIMCESQLIDRHMNTHLVVEKDKIKYEEGIIFFKINDQKRII